MTLQPREHTVGISSRQNNLNVLRFVAAGMVIYGHMFILTGVSNYPLFLQQSVSTIGVRIFFIISGYLITNSFLNDSNILRYTIKRFFRIMPGLFFCVVLTIFVIGPFMTTLSIDDYFSNPATMVFFKNAVLHPIYSLPGVFETSPVDTAVNGSLWSLPVEVLMYIIFPVIVALFRKKQRYTMLLTIAAITVCAINIIWRDYFQSVDLIVHGNSLQQASFLAPYFFIGGLFTTPFFKKLLNVQIGMMLLVFSQIISLTPMHTEIMSFIIFPYAILSFALATNPVFSKFATKNDYSYGLYLYGFPAQQIVIHFFVVKSHTISNTNILFCISFLIALAFAFLSWHLVEKRCQSLGKKLLNIISIKKSVEKNHDSTNIM